MIVDFPVPFSPKTKMSGLSTSNVSSVSPVAPRNFLIIKRWSFLAMGATHIFLRPLGIKQKPPVLTLHRTFSYTNSCLSLLAGVDQRLFYQSAHNLIRKLYVRKFPH